MWGNFLRKLIREVLSEEVMRMEDEEMWKSKNGRSQTEDQRSRFGLLWKTHWKGMWVKSSWLTIRGDGKGVGTTEWGFWGGRRIVGKEMMEQNFCIKKGLEPRHGQKQRRWVTLDPLFFFQLCSRKLPILEDKNKEWKKLIWKVNPHWQNNIPMK